MKICTLLLIAIISVSGLFVSAQQPEQKNSPAPDKPKEEQKPNQGNSNAASEEKVTFSNNIKIGSLLSLIADYEGVPIICVDYSLKDVPLDYTHSQLNVPASKYEETIRNILEYNLNKNGYKIVTRDLVWIVVKLDKTDKTGNQKPEPLPTVAPNKKIIIDSASIHFEYLGNRAGINFTNAKMNGLLAGISEEENIPILCQADSIKEAAIDCIPVSFYLSREMFDRILCDVMESNLYLRGYKIVKKELIWEIVRIKSADGTDISEPESKSIKPSDEKKPSEKDERVIFSNTPKIGALLTLISVRDNITVEYEDKAIRDLSIGLVEADFQISSKYDKTTDCIVESALEMRGYEIIKSDKVWKIRKKPADK